MKRFVQTVLYFTLFGAVTAHGVEIKLLVTCGTVGHLEFTLGESGATGGISARSALFQTFLHQAEHGLIIDMGDLLPRRVEKLDRRVDRMIAQTYLEAMKAIGYRLAAFGPDDLHYLGQDLQSLETYGIPWLATNLSGAESFWKPYVILQVESQKIGFLAVPLLADEKSPGEGRLFCERTLQRIAEAAKTMREKEKADAVILMAHVSLAEAASWLGPYQDSPIDLVMGLGEENEVQPVGKAFAAAVASGDDTATLLTLTVEPGAGLKNVRNEALHIDADGVEDSAMRAFLDQAYTRMAQKVGAGWNGPFVLQNLSEEQDPMKEYAGSTLCLDCHEEAYNQWAETRHATAFNSLFDTNRHWIKECAMCHATGMGKSSGFVSFSSTPKFMHVGCETCHGPGLKHVDAQGTEPIRRTPKKELCTQCHDEKNSPNFQKRFEEYYNKIVH